MKTKDIISVVIAGVLIIGSGYFIYKMLVPTKTVSNQQSSTNNQPAAPKFTGNIDTTTLQTVTERKDYGEAPLNDIGRTNPFGPLN